MPTEVEHAEKYRANRAILDGPPPLSSVSAPWAAIVAFYAALHLIEQLAAREGIHHTRHTGHASRDRYLAFHPDHNVLAASFGALLSASLVARYESAAAFAAAFPGDAVQSRLIDQCLAEIESHARLHLP
jgi:hypothetical protein